ncbi:MAG: GH116 family glycosyl hydrolase [Bacilli bacterium]
MVGRRRGFNGAEFYTYSTSAHALMRKAILELAAWQKQDGALFSPIPAGNYDSELPGQMLASIGRYGFWNYYMNTADIDTIKTVYPAVKKYLSLWTLDETGLTAFRKGGWTWGDWGENRDIRLIFAGWHYIALEAAANMADVLNLPDDAKGYREIMSKVKDAYNKCWNGKEYRHPDYKLLTDDRVQALAVISGIADDSKYPQIKAFYAGTNTLARTWKNMSWSRYLRWATEYTVSNAQKAVCHDKRQAAHDAF